MSISITRTVCLKSNSELPEKKGHEMYYKKFIMFLQHIVTYLYMTKVYAKHTI